MVDAYLRQSPLAHLHLDARAAGAAGLGDAGVVLAEKAHRGQFTLRGDAGDAAFRAAVKKALKIDVPRTPNTVAGTAKSVQLIWQGPDEWLVVTNPAAGPKTGKALVSTLKKMHAAVTDVSESRTVIHLTGADARSVVMKGCSIDFHPRVFGPGQCVETTLALAHALIHQTGLDKSTGHPAYDIYVQRSFAEYLWNWLENAGREYGVRVVPG